MQVPPLPTTSGSPVFTLNQYPEPLPSGLGTTRVFSMRIGTATGQAIIHQPVLTGNQYPEPAPSGVGSTPVLASKGFIVTNTAMLTRRAFLRTQTPPPAPNRIGEEDLPGGFRDQAILSGQASPLYDLSRGIVQIDGVSVLFDATA